MSSLVNLINVWSGSIAPHVFHILVVTLNVGSSARCAKRGSPRLTNAPHNDIRWCTHGDYLMELIVDDDFKQASETECKQTDSNRELYKELQIL